MENVPTETTKIVLDFNNRIEKHNFFKDDIVDDLILNVVYIEAYCLIEKIE